MAFEYRLRFPGQYFDSETGLHYNYFRDYDPATGRYVESDPIGLKGGVNTYLYASNDPLSKIDVMGLFDISVWNTGDGPGTVQSTNNCITFALDYPIGPLKSAPSYKQGPYNGRHSYVQPEFGEIGGIPSYNIGDGSDSCQNIIAALRSEPDFEVKELHAGAKCPGGFYRIGIMTGDAGPHAWRETDEGIYHKNSVNPVLPGTGDTGIYPYKCGEFCVRKLCDC